MRKVLLLTDGKRELHNDLKKLKGEMESLKQIYYRLQEIYADKKKRYEEIDLAWAERDGRLKVQTITRKEKKQESLEQRVNKMSKEELQALIAKLEKVV